MLDQRGRLRNACWESCSHRRGRNRCLFVFLHRGLPSLSRNLIFGIQRLLLQWPEDFNFDITRAINAPSTHHVPQRDSSEDEDEKKSKDGIEAAEVENDESDKELDPAGLQKAFRFAAWSSLALVGPFSPPGGLFLN